VAYLLFEVTILTLICNLMGAPGAGKSTCAAGVFFELKMAGINAEYVSEYVKELVFEDRSTTMRSQPYIFGKQLRNLERLIGKVDVIVTDSPIILSRFYGLKYEAGRYPDSFYQFVADQYARMGGLTYFIRRRATYQSFGRNQSEAESDAIAVEMQAMLDDLAIPYKRIDGAPGNHRTVVQDILELIR
jgi:hypothetical protein